MRKGQAVSLAGFRFFKYHVKKTTFTFKTKEDKSLCLEIPNFGILIPTKINKKVLEEVEPIPSILGTDFLEEYKFTLVFNPSMKIAYLTDELTEK